MPIDTVLKLMIEIFIMVLVGFLMKKRKLIDDDFQIKLSALLTRAILPLSVLATGNKESSPDVASGLLLSGIIATSYYILALLVSMFLARLLKLPDGKRPVFTTSAVFANTAFIGYPIAGALFGYQGVLYAVVYNLLYQIFCFTLGVRILAGGQKTQWKTLFTDPLTLSSLLSILLFISPFRFPEELFAGLQTIGSMSVPLSMLIIGCSLAGMNFKEIWKDGHAYIVSALRLLVFPLAMFFILQFIGVSGTAAAVCVVLTALPPGALNVILAERHGADVHFATTTVIQGMVFMFPGLLVILYFLQRML